MLLVRLVPARIPDSASAAGAAGADRAGAAAAARAGAAAEAG